LRATPKPVRGHETVSVEIHGIETPAHILWQLVEAKVASRLAARDPSLWGPAAQKEASVRLGWLEAPRRSRPLLPALRELRDGVVRDGLVDVVLCGMGGNALAAAAISSTRKARLTVTDTTHPDAVRRTLDRDLRQSVFVISSKSGHTIETEALRRGVTSALRSQGLPLDRHLVAVTDIRSDLAGLARREGYRAVFEVEPDVGGRYSALTPFGLVPTALAGVDVAELVEAGDVVLPSLARDSPDNPALRLAVALTCDPGRSTLVLADGLADTAFSAWVEQLIAESTGKEGAGVLPVVVESLRSAEVHAPPAGSVVAVVADAAVPGLGRGPRIVTSGSLGARFLLWEAATAIACRLLGVNPFDQPDVESAKHATRTLLQQSVVPRPPDLSEDLVDLRGAPELVCGAASVREAVARFVRGLAQDQYLAVLCYADRVQHAALGELRPALARLTAQPVTFGWGPGYLHSTGQLHKGGPARGAFLQVVVDSADDLPVPGLAYGFRQLMAAQAGGDAALHAARGTPMLHLSVKGGQKGVGQLLDCLSAR